MKFFVHIESSVLTDYIDDKNASTTFSHISNSAAKSSKLEDISASVISIDMIQPASQINTLFAGDEGFA